jgi:hypothetical protein
LDYVLNKFDVSTKAFMDQKHEILKRISEFCEQALINHRTIYCDLPKVDGLVEKTVQMVKKGL